MKGKRGGKKIKHSKEKQGTMVSPPIRYNSKAIGAITVALAAVFVATSRGQFSRQNDEPKPDLSFKITTRAGDTIQAARDAVRAAQEDPYSVPKTQTAAEAFLVEGDFLKSSQWSAFALRRQALLAGARPEQAKSIDSLILCNNWRPIWCFFREWFCKAESLM